MKFFSGVFFGVRDLGFEWSLESLGRGGYTSMCFSQKVFYDIPVLVTRHETVLYDFKYDFKGKLD